MQTQRNFRHGIAWKRDKPLWFLTQTCTLQPWAVEFSHTLGANAVGVFSSFNCQILQDEGGIIPHFASLTRTRPSQIFVGCRRFSHAWRQFGRRVFYIHVSNLVLYTHWILLPSMLLLSGWHFFKHDVCIYVWAQRAEYKHVLCVCNPARAGGPRLFLISLRLVLRLNAQACTTDHF